MFAPKVAKPQTKAAESPTSKLAPRSPVFATRRFGGGAVEQAHFLQSTIGNQAALRLLSQRARNLTGNVPHGYNDQEADSASLATREAPRSALWDFSKIPLFPPERPRQSRGTFPHPSIIQPKLVVGQVDDPFEHEADRVAEQVMRMADPDLSFTSAPPKVSRKCTACDEEEKTLQTKPAGLSEAAREVPYIVHEVLRSSGQPLDAPTRAFFEPRFGRDFTQVRIHAADDASSAARAVQARAYTTGRDIVFGAGEYAPATAQGKRLLAHELTHVLQQSVATTGQSQMLQRQVDEESFAKLGGKIVEVGDTGGGGGGAGSAESNEFLLWNYDVGVAEQRAEHTRYLTEKVLARGRWPDMLRADPDVKIAIVAGASSTGDASVNTPLSVARADRIKAFLVSDGIDPGRIVTSGVGSRHPFADETSSENMARNRRVEVFLFRPTRQVASLSGVSVTATNLSASVEVGFRRDMSDPDLLVLRWKPFRFNAHVSAMGPANMTVDIIQFLRSDSRVGGYQSTGGGGNFLLDLGRCMQPDLPCKDVFESLAEFSGSGRLIGPGTGEVSMIDSPGNVVPIQVSAPKSGNLVTAHWEMEFVAVIGARVGDAFLPIKSVVWRLEDDHARDSSGALNPTKTDAKADAPQDGAPSDLAIEKAMAGRTCRFMARRMKDYCRPELAS